MLSTKLKYFSSSKGSLLRFLYHLREVCKLENPILSTCFLPRKFFVDLLFTAIKTINDKCINDKYFYHILGSSEWYIAIYILHETVVRHICVLSLQIEYAGGVIFPCVFKISKTSGKFFIVSGICRLIIDLFFIADNLSTCFLSR